MKWMQNRVPRILMAAGAALWIAHGADAAEAVVTEPSEHHVYLHVVQPESGKPVRIIVSESDVLPPEVTPLPLDELPPVEDPILDVVQEELATEMPEDEAEAIKDPITPDVEEDDSLISAESADEEDDALPAEVRTTITPLPPEAVQFQPDIEAIQTDDPPMGLLLFIFVLAIFLGFELISKVPSQLHTPLMSGSNAISGITIVGALAAAGLGIGGGVGTLLGTLAVAFATINVVGGYMVTNRMLAMFKKKEGGAR